MTANSSPVRGQQYCVIRFWPLPVCLLSRSQISLTMSRCRIHCCFNEVAMVPSSLLIAHPHQSFQEKDLHGSRPHVGVQCTILFYYSSSPPLSRYIILFFFKLSFFPGSCHRGSIISNHNIFCSSFISCSGDGNPCCIRASIQPLVRNPCNIFFSNPIFVY